MYSECNVYNDLELVNYKTVKLSITCTTDLDLLFQSTYKNKQSAFE